VGLASFKTQKQQSLFVRQDNHPSSLSEDQFKKIESQTQAFREQLLRQQAALRRQEIEATQQRIAAAEREYKEKRDRERAELEKRQREEAQERERVAAAERDAVIRKTVPLTRYWGFRPRRTSCHRTRQVLWSNLP